MHWNWSCLSNRHPNALSRRMVGHRNGPHNQKTRFFPVNFGQKQTSYSKTQLRVKGLAAFTGPLLTLLLGAEDLWDQGYSIQLNGLADGTNDARDFLMLIREERISWPRSRCC